MKNISIPSLLICLTLLSCQKANTSNDTKQVSQPSIEDQGGKIVFPNDPETLKFFETEKVKP